MPISQDIKEILMPGASKIKVRDVRIGLGYTAVMLENDQVGLAFTFHHDLDRGCNILYGLHPLKGQPASRLIALLDSTDKIETAVALATANALVNGLREGLLEGDIIEYLHIEPADSIGMVGYFVPLIPRLKEKTSSIFIFEQIKQKQGILLPEEELHRLMPQCEVSIISSTSIVNHTVDDILYASRSCREVVLLGASTPLIPEVFTGTSATFLSGVVVTDPLGILRIVSEGGGVRLFKNAVKKVNISLRG